MTCTCPECKNEIDLSRYPNVAKTHAIECNTCGILLVVKDIKDNKLITEIIDEGK
ncbi:MAG TPA: hypothetical protein VMR73_00255 [Candidatus Paceibacterota bacterium]|nr:hypothetical protein [Candidatus Paceibacterota bacterium]